MSRRMVSALMMLLLLCSLLPVCAEEAITERELPLYLHSTEFEDKIHLVFFDGHEDIPYISAEEMARLMNLIWHDFGEDEGFHVTLQNLNPNALLVRENGTDAYIDFENSMVSFGQYDKFFSWSAGANMLDLVSIGGVNKNAEDKPDLLIHDSVFECNGNDTVLTLQEYSISTPVKNGVGYLPLQTFSDLFISASGLAICYNGDLVAIGTNASFKNELEELTELGRMYYSVPIRPRSEVLIEFTLNELCLALDFHYGLKEEHGIVSFRDYLIRSGLLTGLTDADAKASTAALARLCTNHFADNHSSVMMASPYMDYTEPLLSFNDLSLGQFERIANIGTYYAARARFYPEYVPGYEEIGNTAYVTFDSFTMDLEKDYYTAGSDNDDYTSDTSDVIGLLIYANRQINRENSPIENVVIDLSNNGGGMADVAVCVCSWALGISAVNVQDMNTGAKSVTIYSFDANANHVYNESEDSVNKKNLFCLISPLSFSCGNLVPATFKASGKVTLLGKTSTGGTCTIQFLSAADGTMFCVSGRKRVNTVNNGVFYSVDAGVEPHYYLPKAEMLYDRQKLTDYINSLMW